MPSLVASVWLLEQRHERHGVLMVAASTPRSLRVHGCVAHVIETEHEGFMGFSSACK